EEDLQAFVHDRRPSLPFPLKNAFGSCAYAISPKGAKQFLECCFPLKGLAVDVPALSKFVSPTANIDEILNAYYELYSTYCAIPPLAISPNDHQTSDTINTIQLGSQPQESSPRETTRPSPGNESQELMFRIHGCNPYEGFDHTNYRIDLQGTQNDSIFQELLTKLNPRLVVEVGSWKGDSSLHMAFLIKHLQLRSVVLCVDTWLGSLEHLEESVKGWDVRPYRSHGYPQLYYQFLANVLHHNCQDRIIPLPATSSNAARWMIDQNITADLIYLDASHEEDDVYSDLCLYWRILRPGGVLFGDDWAAYWYGVICAVNRFTKEHKLNLQVVKEKWFLQKPTH
ncbi:MAG: class I SAM-dependent methyltransferase, partial [Planctomycetaceae bacterium]|nr:class I SAM-dependent methyltransferase [Planctomycetaceae bacterium]